MTRRPLSALIDLWPGTRSELAAAMGCTRKALWSLEHGDYRRPPLRLLGALHVAMVGTGLADGSAVPSVADLVAAFLRAKRQSVKGSP